MRLNKKITCALAASMLLLTGCNEEVKDEANYTYPVETAVEIEEDYLEKNGITGYKQSGDKDLNLFGLNMQEKFDTKAFSKHFPNMILETYNEYDITDARSMKTKYYFEGFSQYADELTYKPVILLGKEETDGKMSFFYNASEENGYTSLPEALEANDYGIRFTWDSTWNNTLPEVFNVDYELKEDKVNEENIYKFMLRMIEEYGKPSAVLESYDGMDIPDIYVFFWDKGSYGFSLSFSDYNSSDPQTRGERVFGYESAGYYSSKFVYKAAIQEKLDAKYTQYAFDGWKARSSAD